MTAERPLIPLEPALGPAKPNPGAGDERRVLRTIACYFLSPPPPTLAPPPTLPPALPPMDGFPFPPPFTLPPDRTSAPPRPVVLRTLLSPRTRVLFSMPGPVVVRLRVRVSTLVLLRVVEPDSTPMRSPRRWSCQLPC